MLGKLLPLFGASFGSAVYLSKRLQTLLWKGKMCLTQGSKTQLKQRMAPALQRSPCPLEATIIRMERNCYRTIDLVKYRLKMASLQSCEVRCTVNTPLLATRRQLHFLDDVSRGDHAFFIAETLHLVDACTLYKLCRTQPRARAAPADELCEGCNSILPLLTLICVDVMAAVC